MTQEQEIEAIKNEAIEKIIRYAGVSVDGLLDLAIENIVRAAYARGVSRTIEEMSK